MPRARFSVKTLVTEDNKPKGFKSNTVNLNGYELFKVEEEGTVLLDIVAAPAGANNIEVAEGDAVDKATYYVHRGMGPEGKDMYICPKRMGWSKSCPMCAATSEAYDSGDKETGNQLRAKQRQLWWVKEAGDDQWKVWDVSYHLFGKLLYEELNALPPEDEDCLYYADPEDGYSLKIRFSEKEFGKVKYYETKSIQFKKRTQPLDMDAVDALPPLDSLFIRTSADDIAEAMPPGYESQVPAPSRAPAPVEQEPAPWDEAPAQEAPASVAEPKAPAPAKSDDDDEWEWD